MLNVTILYISAFSSTCCTKLNEIRITHIKRKTRTEWFKWIWFYKIRQSISFIIKIVQLSFNTLQWIKLLKKWNKSIISHSLVKVFINVNKRINKNSQPCYSLINPTGCLSHEARNHWKTFPSKITLNHLWYELLISLWNNIRKKFSQVS